MRDDEAVDDGDAECRRRSGSDLPQRTRTRRAVQQDPVTVTGEEHGDDPRSAVDDRGQRAGEHLVEQGVELGPFLASALGQATQPLRRVVARSGGATVT